MVFFVFFLLSLYFNTRQTIKYFFYRQKLSSKTLLCKAKLTLCYSDFMNIHK